MASDHAATTYKPCVRPPTIGADPTEREVDVQFAATRAVIPSIVAASARSHVAMQIDVNHQSPSTISKASSLANHLTNLSRLVWGVYELRVMKMMVMLALYNHEQAAVFDHMGGGKSHII